MLIPVDALCDGVTWLVKPKNVTSTWGFICCGNCQSIADARDSWMEVYSW